MKKFVMIVSLIMVFTLLTSSTSDISVDINYDIVYRDNLSEFLIESSSTVLSSLESNDNVIYSPVGLYFVLSMIASISDGETLEEITTSMGLEIDSIEENTIKLINFLRKNDNDTKFNIENAIFYDESDGDIYNESAFDSLIPLYDISYERAGFKYGEVNSKIVDFVKEVTDGFLEPKSGDYDFLRQQNIAFLNVLYYKGVWRIPFNKKDTKDEKFYLKDGSEKTVKMMNMQLNNSYKVNENYTSSFLSYKDGNRLVMVLPKDGVSVDDILSSNELLKEAMSLDFDIPSKINYKIPKFDYTYGIDLTDSVKALGMNKMFDFHNGEDHDFIKLMNSANDFFTMSGFKQSSRIQLDEEGVKVASQTIGFGCGGMAAAPLEEFDFFLTKPFIYAITTSDGIPLFVGKVGNPS